MANRIVVLVCSILYISLTTQESIRGQEICGCGPHNFSILSQDFTVYQLLGGRIRLHVETMVASNDVRWGTDGRGSGLNRTEVASLRKNGTFAKNGNTFKIDLLKRTFGGVEFFFEDFNRSERVHVIAAIGDVPVVHEVRIEEQTDGLLVSANVTGTPTPDVVMRIIYVNTTTIINPSTLFCVPVRLPANDKNVSLLVVASNCLGQDSRSINIAGGRNCSYLTGTESASLPATPSSTKAETIPGPTTSSSPDSSPASVSPTTRNRSPYTGTSAVTIRSTSVTPRHSKIISTTTQALSSGYNASLALYSTKIPHTTKASPQDTEDTSSSATEDSSSSAGLPVFVPVAAVAGAILLLVLAGIILTVWIKKRKGTSVKVDLTYENTNANLLDIKCTVKPSEDTEQYDHLKERSIENLNAADDPVNTGISCSPSGGNDIPLNDEPQYAVIESSPIPFKENAEQPSEDVGSGYEDPRRKETMTSQTSGALVSPDTSRTYAQIGRSKKSVKRDGIAKAERQGNKLLYAELELKEKPEASHLPLSDGTVVYAELNPDQPKATDGLQ